MEGKDRFHLCVISIAAYVGCTSDTVYDVFAELLTSAVLMCHTPCLLPTIEQISVVRARCGPRRQPRRGLRDGPERLQLVLPVAHTLGHHPRYVLRVSSCIGSSEIVAYYTARHLACNLLCSLCFVNHQSSFLLLHLGTIFGFLFLCFLAYMEYRRRVKKAAMERYVECLPVWGCYGGVQ